MKLSKILSAALAATLTVTSLGITSVSAAATATQQSLPYILDLSNGTPGTDKGLYYPTTFSCSGCSTHGGAKTASTGSLFENGGMLELKDSEWSNIDCRNYAPQTVEFNFAEQTSGTVVFEFKYKVSGGSVKCPNGMVLVTKADDTKVVGWKVDGRGDGKPVIDGAFGTSSDQINKTSWTPGTYTLKIEVDIDNKKWTVSGDNIKTDGKADNISCSNASGISKLKLGLTVNGDAVSDVKIYKKVAATQDENKKTIEMFVNEKHNLNGGGLSITTGGIRDFTFTSSDPTVATVAATGRITAKKVGTATITVKNEINNINFEYTVNVCEKATSMTVEDESQTGGSASDIEIGGTTKLSVSTQAGTSAGTITWTSSNPSVATVDADGNITAAGKGTATITATGVDGVTASYTINVIVPITGISLSGATTVLDEGESLQLSYSLTPSDANVLTTKWRSGNHTVATVSDTGLVKAVGEGTTEIYVSIGSKYGQYTITVNGTTTNRRPSLISFAEVKGSFTDIADMAWAQSAIQNAAADGIMTPDSEYFFGAKRNITRDELVSVVIKTLELQDETADEPVEKTFDDVDESNPYYAEIMKAVELGIISGINDTSFAPKDDITRQDLAVVVFNALEVAKINTVEGRLDFADKDSIATYAQKAVRTLSKMDIMVGKADGNFDPLANTTRAEAAVIANKITAIR